MHILSLYIKMTNDKLMSQLFLVIQNKQHCSLIPKTNDYYDLF